MRFSSLAAAAAAMVIAIVPPEAAAEADTLRFGARLSGMFEPAGGDSDGFGSFLMEVDSENGRACYTLVTRRIGIASSAAIHARAGWTTEAPLLQLDVTGAANDTCTRLAPEQVRAIAADPRSYQVSVRNGQFPRGALRGQLERR
jgi:hypothetical protein